ncbi:hypothetical protein EJA70_07895 [Pseudomonas sp. PB103]|nr:hypothetical protein EJA70_07895 [Pseudomonas sp. PB103]
MFIEVMTQISHPWRSNCGSWLASDGGVSVKSMLDVPPSSLASQLPQGLSVCQRRLTTRQSCHRHGARSGCASDARPPHARSRIPR